MGAFFWNPNDFNTGGGGGISGPGSSTDNAIVRWNGTGGNIVQNSGVTIDDSDNLTVPGAVTIQSESEISLSNGVINFLDNGRIQLETTSANDPRLEFIDNGNTVVRHEYERFSNRYNILVDDNAFNLREAIGIDAETASANVRISDGGFSVRGNGTDTGFNCDSSNDVQVGVSGGSSNVNIDGDVNINLPNSVGLFVQTAGGIAQNIFRNTGIGATSSFRMDGGSGGCEWEFRTGNGSDREARVTVNTSSTINFQTWDSAWITGLSINGSQAVALGEPGGSQTHTVNGDELEVISANNFGRLSTKSEDTSGAAISVKGSFQSVYDDGSSERVLGQIQFQRTNATASSSGGRIRFLTTTSAGSQTVAGEIDSVQAWTIGESGGSQTHRLNTATATSATAGSNGDVPAQVEGYITININGTDRKIPYYQT